MVHTEPVEPTADEVRLQLDRLIASEGFANADRMSSFLRYVVGKSLAGESDEVKEYVIGVEVFGRDQTYDPRLDSIVRVEARRLRSKLDEYYAREGQTDPVLIGMRRGSYVPFFERQREPRAESAPAVADASAPRTFGWWRLALGLGLAALVLGTVAARRGLWAPATPASPAVSIAVLPFAHYSTDSRDTLLAARLTDGVTSALARLGRIGVVSHTSALQFGDGPRRPLREIGRALNADVLMEGSVSRAGDRVEVEIRLVNAATDRKMWVERFVGAMDDPRDLERRIAEAAAPVALDVPSSRPR
jgi:TolB-like protein